MPKFNRTKTASASDNIAIVKLTVKAVLFLIVVLILLCLFTRQWLALLLTLCLLIGIILAFSWALVHFAMDSHFEWNMIRYSDYESERHFLSFINAQAWFAKNTREVGITTQNKRYSTARWLVNPDSRNNNLYVIDVHGYGNSAYDAMAVSAKAFYQRGFSVLCPSLQAHGVSEGRYLTMGVEESSDIMDWVRWITRQDRQAIVYLYGVSMGASTVMMCASQKDPHLAGIIEDCGYSNAKDEFAYQLKKIFGLPSFPFLPLANLFSKNMSGVSINEMDVRPILAKARVPVLFIHGDKDGFVPFAMEEECANACTGKKKAVVIEEARHGESVYKDPQAYWHAIDAFIKETLAEHEERMLHPESYLFDDEDLDDEDLDDYYDLDDVADHRRAAPDTIHDKRLRKRIAGR